MMKSESPLKPDDLLKQFASMARNSRSPDGDGQGDGWGICWLSPEGEWSLQKSISPIWEDTDYFYSIPKTTFVLAHARSSTFPSDKGVLAFNQPFVSERYAFVFNGFLKGVRLPFPDQRGDIGSQKIWRVLTSLLKKWPAPDALLKLQQILEARSLSIQALNIGLCDKKDLFAYCHPSAHPEYYNLWVFSSHALQIISSAPLEGIDQRLLQVAEIIVL